VSAPNTGLRILTSVVSEKTSLQPIRNEQNELAGVGLNGAKMQAMKVKKGWIVLGVCVK